MKEFHFERKIEDYRLFWRKENSKALISFYIGDQYFFDTRGTPVKRLLGCDQPLSPDMIDVPEFLRYYERQYQKYEEVGVLWSATPFPSFPWMPAFMGCQIHSKANTFWEKVTPMSLEQIAGIEFHTNDPWFMKFIELVNAMATQSRGRYPLGNPLLRGVVDIMAVLRGKTQLLYDLYDTPSRVRLAAENIATFSLRVFRSWYEIIPSFMGGYSFGLYDLWAPERCLRFQEDALALLSPHLYQELFLDIDRRIASAFSYSLVHLHPSDIDNFIDLFLNLPELDVVELCRDPESSVEKLLPIFKRIQKQKLLMFFGELTLEELYQILSTLDPRGLYLKIIVSSATEARRMLRSI